MIKKIIPTMAFISLTGLCYANGIDTQLNELMKPAEKPLSTVVNFVFWFIEILAGLAIVYFGWRILNKKDDWAAGAGVLACLLVMANAKKIASLFF